MIIDIEATIKKAQALIYQDEHMSAALRNRGGQKGHAGTTLKKVDDPDIIEPIKIDRRTLPAGGYHEVGHEARQVFDIDISRVVTEYRAQVLEKDRSL